MLVGVVPGRTIEGTRSYFWIDSGGIWGSECSAQGPPPPPDRPKKLAPLHAFASSSTALHLLAAALHCSSSSSKRDSPAHLHEHLLEHVCCSPATPYPTSSNPHPRILITKVRNLLTSCKLRVTLKLMSFVGSYIGGYRGSAKASQRATEVDSDDDDVSLSLRGPLGVALWIAGTVAICIWAQTPIFAIVGILGLRRMWHVWREDRAHLVAMHHPAYAVAHVEPRPIERVQLSVWQGPEGPTVTSIHMPDGEIVTRTFKTWGTAAKYVAELEKSCRDQDIPYTYIQEQV